ncbi:vitamin B12 transport system substrate-binding protein [Pseudomonas guineae]|uniref:Vitamin B12 transport system substrate-binding protein n=1 Tax=Pseudomonas guineae TaxID=425504 RepID=A0A1I3LHB9_9PSED|nr:helical backbone metal receptor [Pseudomonas guineae]SFI83846.1 vitamin B12 transport system substrate-binding protein [Pseudomonas guineae]|tara:strand:+ start:9898 stop:10695 length:798 start_codon:yes stop_codon:yes gene_type:complete
MRALVVGLLALLIWPAAAAERVVTLAPSLTEIMLELEAGDLLVGLLDAGERPVAVEHLPSVGNFGQLELESLLSLQPDLVLLWPDSISSAQRQQLQRLGIPIMLVEPRKLADLAVQFAEIGSRIGRAEQGKRLRQQFNKGLQRLSQRYQREQPLQVFYQVWDVPLYTLGGQQIISDALRVCGAENIFAELTLPAPQVSVEAVLARNPEVILTSTQGQLDAWRIWPGVAAVEREQLWLVPDDGLERPSFQMLGALEKLCDQLAEAD